MSEPTGTYRLQLTEGFGFAAAGAVAGYLAELGVSHVYLSPILQARKGSAHGYDVVDHARISEALGGEEAFREMAARFHAAGLKIVVDMVPNHMGIPAPETLNRPLWSVLEQGRRSPYARWFDIEWDRGQGRVLLPVLGRSYEECRESGELAVDARDRLLHYFTHVFPSDGEHCRPVFWRVGPNYRRFFEISDLIGLRVEDPEVFDATHATVLALHREGLVDGLRIDHPDGLADPRGYLRRLSGEVAEGTWIVVEKILTGAEELPLDWECAGTTGYDALGMVGGLFVDPAGERPLTDTYVGFTSGPADFAEVEHEAKAFTAEHGLRPEVDRVHRVLTGILPKNDPGRLRTVLVELLVAMPVYRAYVVPGDPPASAAEQVISTAVERARSRLPAELHTLLEMVAELAAGRMSGAMPLGGDTLPKPAEFVVRFQQTSVPLTAKGVEDTAFYRWSRLAALNEVGGDPGRFGVEPFVRTVPERAPAGGTPLVQVPRPAEVQAPAPAQPPAPAQARAAAREIGSQVQRRAQAYAAELGPGHVQGPSAPPGPPDLPAMPSPPGSRRSGAPDARQSGWSRQVGFHVYCERLAREWPATMTTLSTHDTKRQEDVRARLSVLSELPDAWADAVTRWAERTRSAVREAGVTLLPEPDLDYLLWQTLVGAWPLDERRLHGFLTKAMREAKTATSWTDRDDDYENAVAAYATAALADHELVAEIAAFVARIGPYARANTLGQKLVQLTMPGVPDVYQGCELVGLALVDPDNRRPVDYDRRRALLARLDEHTLDKDGPDEDGLGEHGPGEHGAGESDAAVLRLDEEKLLVTVRALRLRRERPQWFGSAGSYRAVAARGDARRHVVAFRRGDAVTVATRLPAGLERRGGWGRTVLPLPDSADSAGGAGGAQITEGADAGQGAAVWRDLLTGTLHTGPEPPLAAVLARLPVALLVPDARA